MADPFENKVSGDEEVSSGDRSGRGRPRRDDHAYPMDRGVGDFGTHGGPNAAARKKAAEEEEEPDDE